MNASILIEDNRCNFCDGVLTEDECEHCDGSGIVDDREDAFASLGIFHIQCSACHGTGYYHAPGVV